jgi:hypothetical protein
MRVQATQWYNSFGQACIAQKLGPLIFASNENRAAWQTAGLRLQPAQSQVSLCPDDVAANAENGFAQGIGAVDVSALNTDPAVLAKELSTGTTGIPGLDSRTSTGNEGFEEAAQLLVGPITGKASSFSRNLYESLALLPGIEKLGEVTTQTGRIGLGFAADTFSGRSTIVVDPNTGQLLESRNVPIRGAETLFSFPLQQSLVSAPKVGAPTELRQGSD